MYLSTLNAAEVHNLDLKLGGGGWWTTRRQWNRQVVALVDVGGLGLLSSIWYISYQEKKLAQPILPAPTPFLGRHNQGIICKLIKPE